MQRIANEMALPETTFVFPPEAPETDARVRIFTPSRELPMAGSPKLQQCHFEPCCPSSLKTNHKILVAAVGLEPTTYGL